MEVTENVRTLCRPVVDDMGIELYDVERAGGILRVTVDSPGGVSLDQVAEATRRISRLLDEHDPVPGRYTLEVTSPGLERALRTPEHFARAVGMQAAVRVRTPEGSVERLEGTIVAADDTTVTIEVANQGGRRSVAYPDVDRARTVFVWGPEAKDDSRRRSAKRSASTAPRAAGEPATTDAGEHDIGDDSEVSGS